MITSGELSMEKSLIKLALRISRRFGVFSVYGFLRSRLVKRNTAIIAYHRIDRTTKYPWSIGCVDPEDFDSEISYLRKRYQILSLDELVDALYGLKTLPRNAAVITIDDGYKDIYLNAYPILRKHNVPATVFLVTGNIGTGNLFWWDKFRYVIWHTGLKTIELDDANIYQLDPDNRQRAISVIEGKLKKIPDEKRVELIDKIVRQSGVDISPDFGKELILSWEEIKIMSRNGIDFGAHTVNHPILTRLPLEKAEKEILDSKRQIEKELGKEVTTFCYPNGGPDDFNKEIEEILKNNGFKCAVTFAPAAFVLPPAQSYRLPRIGGTSSYDMFELIMSGLYFDITPKTKRGEQE
jgi:peptidoglycan/xylan/chitin deacetylase (PgdA/CDA1 family)